MTQKITEQIRETINFDILFYAFRYALYRHTYAVTDVITEMRKWLQEIPVKDITIYIKEIGEYLDHTEVNAITSIDISEWRNLRIDLLLEMSRRNESR
jgi:hypothetical protein